MVREGQRIRQVQPREADFDHFQFHSMRLAAAEQHAVGCRKAAERESRDAEQHRKRQAELLDGPDQELVVRIVEAVLSMEAWVQMRTERSRAQEVELLRCRSEVCKL